MLDNKNTVAKINNMDCEGIIGSFILKNIQNILTVKNKKVVKNYFVGIGVSGALTLAFVIAAISAWTHN
jgi:hypothetical protein